MRVVEDEYIYADLSGRPRYRTVRYEPKDFAQHAADDAGAWLHTLNGVERIPYRLPELVEVANHGGTAFVPEGEKDADRLRDDLICAGLHVGEGWASTTSAGGTGWRWPDTWAEHFRGLARVVILADNDEPGRNAAHQRADVVRRTVDDVRVIEALPGVGEKGDVSDWLDAGGTVDELLELVEWADQWRPPALLEDQDPPLDDLDFYTMAQLVEAVDGTEACGWLCRPVWPADAYGVLAAEKKAGKTWAMLDLVVSVASGTSWLGVYAVERPGPVLVFLGEGGRRKMLRRLRAVCEARGVELTDLPIVASFRAPHLTDQEALLVVSEKLGELSPVLMVIDPLYLAARGAKSSSLYDMGTHLENIQGIAQRRGAALVIAHHWNQTGKGGGADRMSGAGPAEWGRVLASVEIEQRHTDAATRATAVTLGFSFIGDEIPDTELRIRRRVWATDPDHLDSPLHYEVEVLEGKAARSAPDEKGMSPATARVLGVLEAAEVALTVRDIGDVLAGDSTGIPLKKRTIQDSLSKLQKYGLATVEDGLGGAGLWTSAQEQPKEAEEWF